MVYSVFSIIEFVIYSLLLITDWKVLAIDEADPMAAKINDIDDLEKMLPGKVSEVRGSRFVRAIIITRMQERHAAVKRI